ncbi:MAG TPA: cytochrome d ubiquinol oxidase subunit II [Ktedonobacteraceae bacterium]|jgi:cytochrome d ubiquinol oxidase subunit II
MSLALLALCILWLALIAYATLGGADFGAGIWDLYAVGRQRQRQRRLINQALGPVWEANHVWLIFLIVGLLTVFPSAFAALCVALFVPLTIVLVGIVLRGAAFIFRTHELDAASRSADLWSHVFSLSSLLTPFFLGASAAAVASGQLVVAHNEHQSASLPAWCSPFAVTIGLLAIGLCASLAAVYLTQEASQTGAADLAERYRLRALAAGALTALLGVVGLLLSPRAAPRLWEGLLVRALPVVIACMLSGLATAVLLYRRKYRLARASVILAAALLLASWGLSQYPYLIPVRVSVEGAANEPGVIVALLISVAVGMALILPALFYLFTVFKFSPARAPLTRGQERASGSLDREEER